MARLKDWISRHALACYFALAFVVSWGGVLLVVTPSGIPGTPERFNELIPFAVIAMLLGPSLAGLVLTGVVGGRAGFRDLASRLLKWRVGGRWYAAALLTAPVLLTIVHLFPGMNSERFLPGIVTAADKSYVLQLALFSGLGAGLFEELGWTGFAIPRLRLRRGVLATALIVGPIWAAWHMLTTYWGSGAESAGLPPALYVPLEVLAFLPAFRVLMVWVYEATGSLLLAMLMHASLTGSVLLSMPLETPGGGSVLIHDLVFGGALWIVVAVVMLARGRRAWRQLVGGPVSDHGPAAMGRRS